MEHIVYAYLNDAGGWKGGGWRMERAPVGEHLDVSGLEVGLIQQHVV